MTSFISVSYTHLDVYKRQVFGGGETFGVKLRGSYEWQTGNKLDGSNSKINSYELG